MLRAIPLLLAVAFPPIFFFFSSTPATAGDESPYVYKTEEAKRLLYEVPVDRFSESRRGETPPVPFDPIRGVAVPTKEADLALVMAQILGAEQRFQILRS